MMKLSKIVLCFLILLFLIIGLNNTKNVEAANRNDAYWIESNPNLGEYDYSFAVVGDTQNLCRDYQKNGAEGLKYANEYHGIYDWIIANKNSKKIKHVFGLGDITEAEDWKPHPNEWELAKEAISKMDGVISYSLVRGNHDYSSYFNKTFNYPAYTNQFDGFFLEDDICATYKTMTIGSTDFLFFTLNYGPSDEELEWAGEVIRQHNDHKVIITTHGYSALSGLPLDETADKYTKPHHTTDIDFNVSRSYNTGEQMWDKLISQHGNIMLVMSGHVVSQNVVKREAYGIHGNKVIELLIDPQGMDLDGPVGMVCMLYFNEKDSTMDVEWYSTTLNKYYSVSNQYRVDLSESNLPAHDYTYYYDNTVHWQECECEEYTDPENHEWTIDENGTEVCYCGAIKQKNSGCGGSVVASVIGMFSLLSVTLYIKKKQ